MIFRDIVHDQELRDSLVLRMICEGGSLRMKQRGKKAWCVGKIGKDRIMIHKKEQDHEKSTKKRRRKH